MTEQEMLAWIKTATLEQLRELWATEPVGGAWFKGKVGDAFFERMRSLGHRFPPQIDIDG